MLPQAAQPRPPNAVALPLWEAPDAVWKTLMPLLHQKYDFRHDVTLPNPSLKNFMASSWAMCDAALRGMDARHFSVKVCLSAAWFKTHPHAGCNK
jgi:hypothetical protein